MMQSEIDWSKPRRQSKVVILLALWDVIKLIWPILVFLAARFMINRGSAGVKSFSTLLWGLSGVWLIFIIIRINEIARFFYYRFCINDQQLIIFSGLLVKKKTELPLSRIQAIHTRQTFLHKLTNTCKLVIDTAGTEKAEMEIEALNTDLAREFQRALTEAKPGPVEGLPPEGSDIKPTSPLLQLSFKDILKLCISENHFKTFLVIIVFLIGKMEDIREYIGFDSVDWMQKNSPTVNTTALTLLPVFVIGLFFSILVSCARVILRFHGFAIRLGQNDFLMKWGLLETQQKHIPFKKVQLLSWRSNFTRRLMGVTMLRLHATAEDENKEEQKVQVPVTSLSHLEKMIHCYQAGSSRP